jgi:hypothetical protein
MMYITHIHAHTYHAHITHIHTRTYMQLVHQCGHRIARCSLHMGVPRFMVKLYRVFYLSLLPLHSGLSSMAGSYLGLSSRALLVLSLLLAENGVSTIVLAVNTAVHGEILAGYGSLSALLDTEVPAWVTFRPWGRRVARRSLLVSHVWPVSEAYACIHATQVFCKLTDPLRKNCPVSHGCTGHVAGCLPHGDSVVHH